MAAAEPTATHMDEDYETLVTLLPSMPPSSTILEQPDSDSSTIIILLEGKFERIYESRNTPPVSSPHDPTRIFLSEHRSSDTPPRQLVEQSTGAKIRIPADKESMYNIFSTMNIPLRFENKKTIYWRKSSNKWDPIVEGREGLVSRIVEALLRFVEDRENGKNRWPSSVEVKVHLKIEERIRVTEEDYRRMWKAKREGEMVEGLEKMLIRHQEMMVNNKKVEVDLKRVAMMEIEHRYGTITSMHLIQSGAIDAIARRAYEAWDKIMLSKIKRALLVMVVNKEEEEEDAKSREDCSICLGPKCYEEDVVILQFSKCGHSFHERCLLLWLKKTTTCPLCRFPLF